MKNNTKKDEIMRFIIQYFTEHGYAPAYTEIGYAVGLKSKATVCMYVDELKTQGLLKTDIDGTAPRAFTVTGYKFVKA